MTKLELSAIVVIPFEMLEKMSTNALHLMERLGRNVTQDIKGFHVGGNLEMRTRINVQKLLKKRGAF